MDQINTRVRIGSFERWHIRNVTNEWHGGTLWRDRSSPHRRATSATNLYPDYPGGAARQGLSQPNPHGIIRRF
jgi:hypothetical protein